MTGWQSSRLGEGTGIAVLTAAQAVGAFSGELRSGRARRTAPPLALSGQRGPPFFPLPCPSSPPVLKLSGFRQRAGRSSHPDFYSLVSGCVPAPLRALLSGDELYTWSDLLSTLMFEEPEWAEEAPLVASLGPVASRPRPAAASQIKVSGPAGALGN